MEKILFIDNFYYSMDYLSGENFFASLPDCVLPKGLLSIDAYIKKMCPGVETEFEFMNLDLLTSLHKDNNLNKALREGSYDIKPKIDEIYENIRQRIIEFKPSIIAISNLFDSTMVDLFKLISWVRVVDKNVLLVAGGHAVSNLYIETFENCPNMLDGIILGEGEIPFVELIKSENKRKYLEESPYVITCSKVKDGSYKKCRGTMIQDLDDIPIYDYLRVINKYGEEALACFGSRSHHDFKTLKQGSFLTSRGCPFRCTFCGSHSVHGRRVRANTYERIIEEINFWIDVIDVDIITLYDDHVLYDVDRMIKLLDYVSERGKKLVFDNGLAINCITQDFVDALERNNIREVKLALESGSNKVLKNIMHKPLTIEIADKVFKMFENTKIYIIVFYVYGFIDETIDDINDTINYIKSVKYDWVSVHDLMPITGSEIYDKYLELGIIKKMDTKMLVKYDYFIEHNFNKTGYKHFNYILNLDFNFVNNPNIKRKNYELAKRQFESITYFFPDHAFAYRYLHYCMKMLNYEDNELKMISDKYYALINDNEFWHYFLDHFELPYEI